MYLGLKIIDFGVYLVKDTISQAYYGLQKILIQDYNMLMQTKAQIELWSRIQDSQYIVKLVDYHTFNNFFIELVFEPSPEGTLKTYLEKSTQPIPESDILKFMESIAKGINHMHSQVPCIVHSNIKIQNIFVFGKSVKLSGMARCFLESFDPRFYPFKLVTVIRQIVKMPILIMKRSTITTTGKVIFLHRPPEMYESKDHNYKVTRKVDIWMMGCVLYTMIYKNHPFVNADKNTIINAKYQTPKTFYSEKMMDFLSLLLIPNPELRPSSEKVLEIISKWDKLTKIEMPEKFVRENEEKAKESFFLVENKEKNKESVHKEKENSGNVRENNLFESSNTIINSFKKIEELKNQNEVKKPSRELGICNYVSHGTNNTIPGLNILKDLFNSENHNQETNTALSLDKFRDNLKRAFNMLPICVHQIGNEDQESESSISHGMNKIESFKVIRMFERYIESQLINLENQKDNLRRLKREIKIIKLNFEDESKISDSDYGGKFAIRRATGIEKQRRRRRKEVSSDYDEYEDDDDDFYSDEFSCSSPSD